MTLRPASLREWLVVVFAGAAISLPYLEKPFHIDDVLYLRVTEQILRTPLDPYQGVVLWDAKDGQPASLFLTDHNPPLWKYVQSGVLYQFTDPDRRGESERVLHLLQSVAVILAGLGVFQLGRRLTPYPLWAALTVLTAPFFLPGQNIMLEAPVLCLSVWGVELQCRAWGSRRGASWSLLAGVLLAAAVLTKYSAGVLLPVLAVESIRRRRAESLAFLVVPAAALLAWGVWCTMTHGQPHLGAHGLAFDVGQWHYKTLNVLRLLGSAQVLGGALLFGLLLNRKALASRGWWWLGAALSGAIGVAWLDVWQARQHSLLENADVTSLQQIHFQFFTGHGVVSLAVALLAWRGSRTAIDRDDAFVWIWIAEVIVFNVCCTPFNAVRHLLLFFVPFVFLMGRLLARIEAGGMRWGALAASGLLGIGLASADYQFAESARQVAQNEVRGLVVERAAAGRTVWFNANWGFVFYASRAGARPWVKDPEQFGLPPIQAGDLLVQPMMMSWTSLDAALPKGMKLEWIKHWQPMARIDGSPAGVFGQLLRTIAPGVNYYSIRANALPWELLVMPVDPHERGTGALFSVPTLGDYRVYRVVADGSAGS